MQSSPLLLYIAAMNMYSRIFVALLMVLALAGKAASAGMEDLLAVVPVIERDYRAFYLDGAVMGSLGAGLLGAGFVANSELDREAHEYYQHNIRSSAADSFSEAARIPGDVLVAIPLLFGTYALSGDGAIKSWAGDSLRAFIVGAPAGFLIQYGTGASRPEEGGSGWKPFRGNNGLSGHAFTGAVPFITAAKRQGSPAMKSLLYGLSVLPGLSRINDEKHYLSQAALGWWLAYLSVSSIENTREIRSVRVGPFADGLGIAINVDF